MMSYLSIMKNKDIDYSNRDFVSTGGTNIEPIKSYINKNDNIEKLIICVDNDEAGLLFSKRIKDTLGNKYQVIEHLPTNKDYNLDLIEINNQKEIDESQKETTQELENDVEMAI